MIISHSTELTIIFSLCFCLLTDWFEECLRCDEPFPTCEDLLRNNWYLADPLPDTINDNLRENERFPVEKLLKVCINVVVLHCFMLCVKIY